jgi:hypothetical protein
MSRVAIAATTAILWFCWFVVVKARIQLLRHERLRMTLSVEAEVRPLVAHAAAGCGCADYSYPVYSCEMVFINNKKSNNEYASLLDGNK